MKRYLSAVARLAAGALLCPFAAACGGGENGDGEENVKAIYLDSVSGDDENSGRSPQRAYKTLAPLARGEEVEPGTTIYLNGEFKGTLSFKGSGTEEEPIVVTSLDGENPALIDGDGGGCTVLLDGQSHVTLDNLEITMTADNLMARNGIFVVGESGIISGITIKDCYIRNIHGTHLGQVEAGDYWDSFYASGAISFRYLKDKTDEQNKFDRITVTGCRIENILGCGIRFHDMGAGIIDEWANAYFSNVLIEDTLIDTTSADGILFQNCYKPVVRRCKVFRVGALEPEGSQNYHAAVWACATESPLYEYNEVAYTKYVGGDGQAFDMDWGCKGVSVWQYNYTHDNEGGVMLRHEDFKGIYR